MPVTPTTPALPEVERAVLGAMLVYPEDAAKAVIEAGTVIFDKPQHAAIFKTLEYLYEHGEPIDQLTVAARLEHEGVPDNIGGEMTNVEGRIQVPRLDYSVIRQSIRVHPWLISEVTPSSAAPARLF